VTYNTIPDFKFGLFSNLKFNFLMKFGYSWEMDWWERHSWWYVGAIFGCLEVATDN